MLRFTLKQCEYFEAVAEYGGIAQAARALGVSQPAVAQGLDRLEELTGLTLFHRRHARGADLTIHGRAFRAAARRLLTTAAGVESEALAVAANLAGTLRLGCFHTLAPFCVAALVRGYAERRPDVALETSEHRHDGLISGLTDGTLDLAILYDMDLGGTGLRLERLASLTPRVLLPAAHSLASRRRVRLRSLADEPFVLLEGPGSSVYFRTLLAGHGIDPPVAIRCQSMESVRSAVGHGLGFSLTVIRPATDLSHDGHRLVELPIEDDVATLDVVLAGTGDTVASTVAKDFENFCRAQFEQLL